MHPVTKSLKQATNPIIVGTLIKESSVSLGKVVILLNVAVIVMMVHMVDTIAQNSQAKGKSIGSTSGGDSGDA